MIKSHDKNSPTIRKIDQAYILSKTTRSGRLSIRSTTPAKRDSVRRFSVGLAAIAQEEDFDDANAGCLVGG
jgi:hypothetical protein